MVTHDKVKPIPKYNMKKLTKLSTLVTFLSLLIIPTTNTFSQQCYADFSYSYITQDSLQFNDLSTCSSGYNIVNWIWDFGDGESSNLSNPTHQFNNTGVYNVELTISIDSNGYVYNCNVIKTITITSLPSVSFTWSPEPTNLGDPTSFFGYSGEQLTNWSWDFGDGNSSMMMEPMHIYLLPGIYNVEFYVTDIFGYSNSVIHQVSVTHTPGLDFSWNYGCEADPVQFTILSPPTDITAVVSWDWNFGDGGVSFVMEPSHIYTTSGTYNVSLTINDTMSTTNTVVKQITINPPPISSFQTNSPTCLNNDVQFIDVSTTPTGFITEWYWDFGDGNTQLVTFPDNPNVTHLYSGTGTYLTTLTITNSDSCSNSSQRSVTILTTPIADYTYEITCVENPVFFTDLSSTNGGTSISNWYWNFGDPTSGVNDTTTLQNPAHSYSSPGNYEVELVITNTNGCTDTTFQIITLTEPALDFTFTGDCYGSTTYFEVDETITNIGEVQSWHWDFGDSGTSNLQNPNHLYAVASGFNVTLSIVNTSNCTAEITHNIIINPLPSVEISANTNTANIGIPIQFYGINTGNISNWYWEFGDGEYSFEQNPIHAYQNYGDYNVTLEVTNTYGCINSDTAIIHIIPPPIFPDSLAIWNTIGYSYGYQESRFRYGLIGDTTITVSKDTSYSYSKVYSLYDSTLSIDNSTYFGAIRTTDDSKVYLKLPELPETILYDYSLEIGDTIWFNIGGSAASGNVIFWEEDHYKVVTNKDSILLLDNQYHKQLHMKSEIMDDIWVEQLGSIVWFGLFNPIISDIATNGDSYSFACFKQNEFPLYVNNPDCDNCFCYFLTSIQDNSNYNNPTIDIYPNPANEIVNIQVFDNKSEITELIIYNSIGRKIISRDLLKTKRTEIDIRTWSKGVYLVIIQNGSNTIGYSKFVIE